MARFPQQTVSNIVGVETLAVCLFLLFAVPVWHGRCQILFSLSLTMRLFSRLRHNDELAHVLKTLFVGNYGLFSLGLIRLYGHFLWWY